MKNKNILIIVGVFLLIFFIKSLFFIKSSSEKKEWSFSNFVSSAEIKEKDSIGKKTVKFIGYGVYKEIPAGKYEATFHMNKDLLKGSYSFDIAYQRGKKILVKKELTDKSSKIIKIMFKLKRKREIEPRVSCFSCEEGIKIEKVVVKRIGFYLPVDLIIFQSLFISILLILIFYSFKFLVEGKEWGKFFSFFFLLYGFYLIFKRSWVSEDAFITLRIVKNFLSGNGPVFNIGERVEGFTHALWFFIISLFKSLGLTYKAAVIFPGLIFSFLALCIIFYRIRFKSEKHPFYFTVAILIGTSAFIDFGTSGLETSLSYLLLALYAYFISEEKLFEKPFLFGLIITALVLNRPDFGVFLILTFIIYSYELLKKKIKVKNFFFFLLPQIIFIGGYEIFRMGYYANIFPNPFYTKTGAGSYFSQGLLYLKDFSEGSLFLIVLVIVIMGLIFNFKKDSFNSRFLIFFSGFLHGFFVIRGGGDFMHGRFLLPAYILISISGIGIFDFLFKKNKKMKAVGLVISILLFFISLSILPVQKRGKYYNDGGISDERFAYYKNRVLTDLDQLYKEDLIFMWKSLGEKYHYLYTRSKVKINIAYKNIGFLGFYAGPQVYVIDKLGLTDPIVSRLKIKARRRPGHEKYAPFAYLELKRLTFGTTPFMLWNRIAKTDYGILWDLSPKALKKFSFFLPKNFKHNLDAKIIDFISKCNASCQRKKSNFLFFLKKFWFPYANTKYKEKFTSIYDRKIIEKYSSDFQWIKNNKGKYFLIRERITGELDFRKFIDNIEFAILKSSFINFDEEVWKD